MNKTKPGFVCLWSARASLIARITMSHQWSSSPSGLVIVLPHKVTHLHFKELVCIYVYIGEAGLVSLVILK